MVRGYQLFLLVLAVQVPLFGADGYERVSMLRIVHQQEIAEQKLAKRTKRCLVTGAVAVSSVATFAGILAYQYKTQTGWFAQEPPVAVSLDVVRVSAGELDTVRMNEFIQHQREAYTFSGMLKKGVVNGLIAAFVAFILARANESTGIIPGFWDTIFPWGDMPVLLPMIQKTGLVMRRYERIVLEHLQQQVALLPELVTNAIERNKRFEHGILVRQIEQLVGTVFAIGGELKHEAILTLAQPLLQAVDALGNSYKDTHLDLSAREALLSAMRVHLEQFIGQLVQVLESGDVAHA